MNAPRDFVIAVQTWLGVTADGDPGPKTWEAWRKRTGGPSMAPGPVAGPLIHPAKFAAFAPQALPGTYSALEAAAQGYGFKGLVLAHWLGQMFVESGGFRVMEESLNYSVAGLRATFGKHRISDAQCAAWGRKPGQAANQRAIANQVYGGAWGLKNLGNPLSNPNAGWDNRGSGFKQITGERNIKASGFTAAELRTDVDKSANAAAHFFVTHGCVAPALKDDVEAVTLKVNGGRNGLAERQDATAKAKAMLGL